MMMMIEYWYGQRASRGEGGIRRILIGKSLNPKIGVRES